MIDLRAGRRRSSGAEPARSSCAVLLVIRADAAASEAAAAAAVAACERAVCGAVGVVLILPIAGYAFGLPNPGLLPNARERTAADTAIQQTVHRLERRGLDVDGEIVVTRNARRAVERIARRRTPDVVLVEQPVASRVRRMLEGDLVAQLARRLAPTTVTRV